MQAAAATLGISVDATAKQARKAYRKKALECHPDRHSGREAQFQKLSQAYETFTKPAIVPNPFHFDTRSTFT